jgi:hypothetical protein
MFEYEFTGRCPSKTQVTKTTKIGMQSGATHLSLSWGENMIEMVLAGNGRWYGGGWIRSISGQDLAQELSV